jgi:hypothetical protein
MVGGFGSEGPGKAVRSRKEHGKPVDDSLLHDLSPLGCEHIDLKRLPGQCFTIEVRCWVAARQPVGSEHLTIFCG